MLQTYDRESVENIPFGTFSLLILGSPFWAEENRTMRLFDTIQNIIKQVIEDGQLPACTILRLLIATSDLPTEVAKWQQQLGQPEGVSSEGTVGKTLSWGSSDPESSYSIIILEENLAFALVEDDLYTRANAVACMVQQIKGWQSCIVPYVLV